MGTVSSSWRPGPRDLVVIPGDCVTSETHISVLYFLGGVVYKTKKSLDFGFADFRSLAARRAACEREVELNGRLSPDVYLGVVELSLPTGAAEPAVAMRRLPAERALSVLVEKSDPSTLDEVRLIARTIAAFHTHCAVHTEPMAPGSFESMRLRWRRECEQLMRCARTLVDDSILGEVSVRGAEFLDGRRRLFDERLSRGMILDGHGDLQAADIFILDDGPRIIDCLEFDSRLRIGDVLLDVAFLAMDLERLGAVELSAAFVAAYREFSAGNHPPQLLDFFIAYRALVRAKVAAIRWEQGDRSQPGEVQRLVDICIAHLRRVDVRVVLVGGLPGSGKSTVARELAREIDAHYVSSDDIRDDLRGGNVVHPAPVAWGSGPYTNDAIRQVYGELRCRTEALISEGFSVVLDASWSQEAERQAVRRLVARYHGTLTELCCEVDDSVAIDRLRTRVASNSDADGAVHRRMSASFQPWPEARSIDTGGPPARAVARALHAALFAAGVRARGEWHGRRRSEVPG